MVKPIAREVKPSRVMRYIGLFFVLSVDVRGLPKIGDSFCYQGSDVAHDMLVVLPEHLRHLEAGGHGLVVLKDGHEVATF